MLYGATFISLKPPVNCAKKPPLLARKLWLPTVVLFLVLSTATYYATDILSELGVNPGAVRIAGVAALLLAGYFLRKGREGWAFIMVAVTLATTIITAFMIMFPRVMISSLTMPGA